MGQWIEGSHASAFLAKTVRSFMKSRSELVYQRTMLLSETDFLLGSRTGELRSAARGDGEIKVTSRCAQDEKRQPKLVNE
jgi:hypothetical protein